MKGKILGQNKNLLRMKSFKKILASFLLLMMLTILTAFPALGQGQDQAISQSTYIIVFNEGVAVDEAVEGLSRAYNLRPTHTYSHAIQGMAAVVPEGRLNGLRNDPRVAYVEADQRVNMDAQEVPTGIQRTFADENGNITIDGSDDYRIDVDVAIIDTGVDLDHTDLNVYASTNCARGGPMNKGGCRDGDGDDGNGHGSHVAGTVAAIDNGNGVVGMAPGARVWSVRVLDNSGSGWMSWIIAGVDWVTAHSAEIEAANMSLGCECSSDALDTALSNSVAAGVAYAVAAGNSDADASTHSPANHTDVLTVSALADFDGEPGALGSPTCRTDEDDTLANFSNWGNTVDISAPGVCIYSTWNNGGYATISGTSMASPHAAGALALLASINNPSNSSDVYDLYSTLTKNGNLNWVDDSGDGIKEPLLDVNNSDVFAPVTVSGSDGGTGGGTDNLPTVNITSPSEGSTVSGTITVSADATDDNGVTQVEFFVDGGSIEVDSDGSNGWSVSWNTESVADGSHTVTATATDTTSQTASDSVSVTVDNVAESYPISLSATGEKIRGTKYTDLSWSGANSTEVDIYRDGSVVVTTANDDGEYRDNAGKGGGTHTYQLCEAGTSICSNQVSVTY